jgi:hypothetical protein
VAVDAIMDAGEQGDVNTTDNGTTNNGTGITVGASATLLLATAVYQGSSAATSKTATWNGVSMALSATQDVTHAGAFGTSAIFTLVSPASGSQALNLSWTNTCDCYVGAISFTGTDTTTGIEAGDTQQSTTGIAITVTSTTDGATVGAAERNSGEPTMTGTTIWKYAVLDPGGGSDYQIGGVSNVHTFTFAGGTEQAMVGVHIIAGAAGTPGNTGQPLLSGRRNSRVVTSW